MFALATTRNKSFSGDQPIQETHVVCNIVAGVVTLGLACMFAAGWVRSEYIFEGAFYQRPEQMVEVAILSYQSSIYLWKLTRTYQIGGVRTFAWYSYPLPHSGLTLASPETQWDWRFLGFGVCHFGSGADQMRSLAVPYWSIVIPLTLLSAWLLLSRPKQTKPTTEPPV